MAGLGVSVGLAIVTGIFAGFIASRSFFKNPVLLFDDRDNFGPVAAFPKINGNEARFADGKKKSVVSNVTEDVHHDERDDHVKMQDD